MIVSVHRVACEGAAVVSISYCMKYNGRKDGCCSSKALRSYYLWISKSIQSYDATERSVLGKVGSLTSYVLYMRHQDPLNLLPCCTFERLPVVTRVSRAGEPHPSRCNPLVSSEGFVTAAREL